MNDEKVNYLKSVKQQYEELPYPPRDPENEKSTLICTQTEFLGKINHYCFRGQLNTVKKMRVLVAGGGTGDALIFLAEQLKDQDAEVVYLDLSEASIEVAKKRAAIRQLENIIWIQGSILELPDKGIGKFDYINCCGVLHHLEDPVLGLKALKSCLKDDGALGIMVYAQYGRTGIYHMQELMRYICKPQAGLGEKIDDLKKTINCLPESNCLISGPMPLTKAKAAELENADFVDLFLHTQDRAYTVPEIYEWMGQCNLKLVDFVINQPLYDPATHVDDKTLLKKIMTLSKETQQAAAEIMVSTIYCHVFYATLRGGESTIANFSDIDNIPYLCDILPLSNKDTNYLHTLVWQQAEKSNVRLFFPMSNVEIFLPVEKLTKYIFKQIDGKASIKKIIKLSKQECSLAQHKITNKAIIAELKRLYTLLNQNNVMLLRSKGVESYKTYSELQK